MPLVIVCNKNYGVIKIPGLNMAYIATSLRFPFLWIRMSSVCQGRWLRWAWLDVLVMLPAVGSVTVLYSTFALSCFIVRECQVDWGTNFDSWI